jgi:hypothetical protein
MIRVAKYTERLDNLTARGRLDEADNEFEKVAVELLGITYADLFASDAQRLQQMLSESDGIAACRKLGYDLIISGTVPVACWEGFAILIMAKCEGIIPNDPTERARRRLAIEAADFLL